MRRRDFIAMGLALLGLPSAAVAQRRHPSGGSGSCSWVCHLTARRRNPSDVGYAMSDTPRDVISLSNGERQKGTTNAFQNCSLI